MSIFASRKEHAIRVILKDVVPFEVFRNLYKLTKYLIRIRLLYASLSLCGSVFFLYLYVRRQMTLSVVKLGTSNLRLLERHLLLGEGNFVPFLGNTET